MKLDLPTLGKPVSSSVRVLGSRAGRRARCLRTSSRYESDAFCLLSSVHMRPSAARLSCLHRYSESPADNHAHTTGGGEELRNGQKLPLGC